MFKEIIIYHVNQTYYILCIVQRETNIRRCIEDVDHYFTTKEGLFQ